ncbi:response regulator [Candidatus Margulisiibacteriota bacterium]
MTKNVILITGIPQGEYFELAKNLEDKYDLIYYEDIKDALSLYEMIFSKINTIIYFPDKVNIEENKKIISKFKAINPLAEIIIITHGKAVEKAVECMKAGAADYLIKPYSKAILLSKLNLAAETENAYTRLKQVMGKQLTNQNIVGRKMKDIIDNLISKIIKGEIISGKEIKKTLDIQLPAKVLKEIIKKPKVLIVEDDKHFGPFLKKIVGFDFAVDLAEDGATAMNLLKKNNNYDVIILDIFLPDISGEKLLPKLKEISSNFEVIVLTAYKIVDIAVDTLQHGALDYVNKPVDEEELLAKIRKAVRSRLLKLILPNLSEEIISETLPKEKRIKVLEDLYLKKKKANKPFCMGDIYLFFPGLKDSMIAEDKVISRKTLDDGLLLYIEKIENKIAKPRKKVNK